MAGEIVRFVRRDPIPNRGLSMADERLWRLDVKPKDIYVAASLLNQENALRFSLRLQDAGFQVTSRWLRRDFSKKPTKDDWPAYVALEEEMGNINLQDLDRADTLVLLADVPSTSGGFCVELGYFLGARRTNIVVVGERPNVFFWVDSVRFTTTVEGLVEWLLDESHGSTLPATLLSDYDKFVDDMWFLGDADLQMPEAACLGLCLVGEAGEVAEKLKKAYRDQGGAVDADSMVSELGDVLYYLVRYAHLLGTNLEGVAKKNVEKLKDRAARGKLRGEGDGR